jgi:membrane-associated phospholipid phosphatase
VTASPHLGIVAFPLAITVAASRVVLRVHYVSDVLAGAALGLAAAIGVVHVLF